MEVEEGCGGGGKAVVCNNRDRGKGGGFSGRDRCSGGRRTRRKRRESESKRVKEA